VRATALRLLATPAEADSLARLMQSLGRRYGAYFNRRHARSGGLWDGRFRATVIEPERHLLEAMVWVETPDDAPHAGALAGASSLQHHVGTQQDLMVGDHAQYWALGNTPFERELAYRQRLASGLPLRVQAQLMDAALRGWPLGSAEFVAALAGVTERRLSPLPRGRRVRAKA
jgi:putative transposase